MTTTCKNCGTAITAAFCATCGQRSTVRPLSVRHLVATSFGELTSFEQPLLRTLRSLLLHPGRVVTDYVAGRRVRYTNPIKWALVSTTLAFVAARLIGGSKPARIEITRSDEEPAWLRTLLDMLSSNLAILLVLVMLPLLALSLRICFWRGGRSIAEELVLVLYAYGCAALLQALLAAIALLGVPTQFSGMLPVIWTAWAAVQFHHERRAWVSVLLTLLAHVLWVCMIGLGGLALVGLGQLL